MDYRETALLVCAVMVFVCMLGVTQLLQNAGMLKGGVSSLHRLYRANRTRWMLLVPASVLAICFGLWEALLYLAPTDPRMVAVLCEVLVVMTFVAAVIITRNMRLEAEKFRRAGEKLEQFIRDMKTPSKFSAEEIDNRILEARLTALEVKELMGRKPTDDTWLGENGESQFR